MATVTCGLPAPTETLIQHPRSCLNTSCNQRASVLSPRVSALPTLRIRDKNVHQKERGNGLVVRMGIRAVESFDASFQLTTESEQLLHSMLQSETFIKQVARDCSLDEDARPEFTGEVFQPVPWSQTTKHGMLPEYEKYYHDKENYVIINVPPQVMFKAKIFKPSRLCAIFKKTPPS